MSAPCCRSFLVRAGGPHEAGCAAAAGPSAGAVYLDPGDGELVQVLPASAWDPDRWGPPAPLPVVRVLVRGKDDRWTKPGEVAQRDLAGWTLVPERVLDALRWPDRRCARCGEKVPADGGAADGHGYLIHQRCKDGIARFPQTPQRGGGEVPPEGWVP